KLFTTLRVNSPSFSSRIVPLFDTMLEHQSEGSGTPTEPHHTPSPEADTSHPTTLSIPLPSIPTALIPPDRATIAKSSTLPYDLAPRVISPAADKGSMQHNISELTTLCTSLQRQYSELQAKFQAQKEEIIKLKKRVKVLEDKEDVAVTQSGDDAPIKGRSIHKGEAATERISNDSKEIARVLTSMDVATALVGGIDVPTGSGFIPIAGSPATVISTGSEVGPTASPIATRKKGKEVMVKSDTPKKKKLQEQIDAQADTSYPTTSSIPLPSIPTAPIPPVTQPDPTPIRQYSRKVRIAQSSAFPTVADEHASPDMATIAKSSTLPYDSAPRVTSPTADEGSMQHTIYELTALCTSRQRQYSELLAKFQAQEEEIVRLKERVQVLEDREGVAAKQSGDDAPINGEYQ
nr:hypothetical protein [Tanacetum cinerariifolium]